MLNIRRPGDLCLVNEHWFLVLVEELERIIEKALGDEAAGNGWIIRLKFITTYRHLLMFPQITILNNWVAISQICKVLILSFKLLLVPRQEIRPMVLIIVFKAIVNVDWPIHVSLYLRNIYLANFLLKV